MLEYSCLNKRGEIMFLYKKIKEARIEKKMTQKQLAEELTKKGRYSNSQLGSCVK